MKFKWTLYFFIKFVYFYSIIFTNINKFNCVCFLYN